MLREEDAESDAVVIAPRYQAEISVLDEVIAGVQADMIAQVVARIRAQGLRRVGY